MRLYAISLGLKRYFCISFFKIDDSMNQLTNHIMMVRPASFGFNTQTAANNTFQSTDTIDDSNMLKNEAIKEFDNMVDLLRSKGIDVVVIQDTETPAKPDAVFPNNWISFHEDGAVITYPMFAPNRRIERSEDIIDEIGEQFQIKKRYSFEFYEDEKDPQFLEGTGSMILDKPNGIVYACLSPRTEASLIDKYNVLMGTTSCLFNSYDRHGHEVYHTNVMMALGEDFVVICMESIHDEDQQKMLRKSFEKTGKEIVDITYDQMENFAGNMLEVKNDRGERFLCMSQLAYNSLRPDQIEQLSSKTNLLPIPIPNIEKFGGGSVRCMMAEIFLQKK